jgi:precorrin-8X/cobalt-precorrin-8 methylmutase
MQHYTNQPWLPQEIETESFRRIEAAVGDHGLPPLVWPVVRRIIHASADVEYLQQVRMHPDAVTAGIKALREGRPIITDTRMLLAGISTGRLQKLGVQTLCLVNDPEVAEDAARRGITRSAAAMDKAIAQFDGGIIAIGNAPTALWRLLELLDQGQAHPALIVGIPVGFVGAAESKEALTQRSCPYITALGPKGGTAVTASAINALAILALSEVLPEWTARMGNAHEK